MLHFLLGREAVVDYPVLLTIDFGLLPHLFA